MVLANLPATKQPTQVLWLRQTGPDQNKLNKVDQLMSRCIGEGFSIRLLHSIDTSETIDQNVTSVLQSDLVILESFGSVGSEANHGILCRVRQYSRAPVVLLTEDISPEHSIEAIQQGADTVLPLYISADVALARFHALLRRWTPRQNPARV